MAWTGTLHMPLKYKTILCTNIRRHLNAYIFDKILGNFYFILFVRLSYRYRRLWFIINSKIKLEGSLLEIQLSFDSMPRLANSCAVWFASLL
jgi:hypothetical protein